ncbi:MAG: PEP-CTERM sorting domain-containing protein [Phycisphaerae bacterium]|nr:PEP-CTERM sorting domain-containing protein [Phycisphaerae bacterium]
MLRNTMANRHGGRAPVAPAIALLTVLFLAAPVEAEEMNLLFYGNSFTMGSWSTRSVPDLVNDIAVAAGQQDPYVVMAAVGGWSLADHLASNTGVISTGIPAGETWDYVVFQDYSTRPTHIGDLAGHRADFVSMYQAVAAHSPAAQVIGFETWARAPGHEFYEGSPAEFPGGPPQMQQELRDGYALSTADVNTLAGVGTSQVAPVGDAWEYTGWSNLHAADLYHANNRGTLLASLVIYGTIYQDDVSDVDLTNVLASLGMPKPYGDYLASVADEFIVVPEPSTVLLTLAGLLVTRRRRK